MPRINKKNKTGTPNKPSQKKERLAQKLSNPKNDPITSYQEIYPNADRRSAQVRLAKILKQDPDLKNRVTELMELQGLGVVNLNERLADLISAKKTIVHNNELVEVNDNATSLNAINTAFKLHNMMDTTDNRQVSITINNNDPEKLLKIAKEMKEMNEAIDIGQSGEIDDAEIA